MKPRAQERPRERIRGRAGIAVDLLHEAGYQSLEILAAQVERDEVAAFFEILVFVLDRDNDAMGQKRGQFQPAVSGHLLVPFSSVLFRVGLRLETHVTKGRMTVNEIQSGTPPQVEGVSKPDQRTLLLLLAQVEPQYVAGSLFDYCNGNPDHRPVAPDDLNLLRADVDA